MLLLPAQRHSRSTRRSITLPLAQNSISPNLTTPLASGSFELCQRIIRSLTARTKRRFPYRRSNDDLGVHHSQAVGVN